MKIPSTEECIELMDEFDMPDNVREHCFAVNRVSMIIAKKLKQKGIDIDLNLVNAASLLHDVDKIHTLENIKLHGTTGHQWLSKKDHSKVGEIVKKHILPHHAESWEEKVVNYADKRCSGGEIVSLDDRYEYIKRRYASYYSEKHKEDAFKLEKEIFDKIDIKPENIRDMIIEISV